MSSTATTSMKKRDDMSSSRRGSSSSSRSPENLHSKSIGCMSGILQLLCKYNHRRPFLALGRKPENKRIITKAMRVKNSTSSIHRGGGLSCDVPRSPTLPAEIRRDPAPALLERLMGLEEESPVLIREKRKTLLRALEKCDEDLNALKRIIEVVKSTIAVDSCLDRHHTIHHRFAPFQGELGEEHEQRKMTTRDEDMTNIYMIDDTMTLVMKKSTTASGGFDENECGYDTWNNNKATMMKAVNEVCKEIDLAEKVEIGVIVRALHDGIWRDLIYELLRDFMSLHPHFPHSFHNCRKRLLF